MIVEITVTVIILLIIIGGGIGGYYLYKELNPSEGVTDVELAELNLIGSVGLVSAKTTKSTPQVSHPRTSIPKMASQTNISKVTVEQTTDKRVTKKPIYVMIKPTASPSSPIESPQNYPISEAFEGFSAPAERDISNTSSEASPLPGPDINSQAVASPATSYDPVPMMTAHELAQDYDSDNDEKTYTPNFAKSPMLAT